MSTIHTSNKLHFHGLLNARDLGGYPIRNGGETQWKSIIRGDEPARLQPEGIKALLDYGVRTVIDLRFSGECEARPHPVEFDANGLKRVHISLCGDCPQSWQEIYDTEPGKEKWNGHVLKHQQPQLCSVMRAIAEAPEGAVFFHCLSGKDRTGLIATLLLAVADVELEAIAYDYAVSSECLRDAYLGADPGDEREAILEQVRCPEAQVHKTLEFLNSNFDGVEGYLQAIGLSRAEVSAIRARLRS